MAIHLTDRCVDVFLLLEFQAAPGKTDLHIHALLSIQSARCGVVVLAVAHVIALKYLPSYQLLTCDSNRVVFYDQTNNLVGLYTYVQMMMVVEGSLARNGTD